MGSVCENTETASLVELDPAPATTGTRLFAVLTQISMIRRCSSWLTVGLSPVVPTGTRPCDPSAICQSTKAEKAFSSTAPSANGVMSAVIEPLSIFVRFPRACRSAFLSRRAAPPPKCGHLCFMRAPRRRTIVSPPWRHKRGAVMTTCKDLSRNLLFTP